MKLILGNEPGNVLDVEISSEDITIRPARSPAKSRKKHGVWVYRAGEPLSAKTVERTIQKRRSERQT